MKPSGSSRSYDDGQWHTSRISRSYDNGQWQTITSTAALAASTTTTTTIQTYDNGQWHTTYPAWNGTIVQRARFS